MFSNVYGHEYIKNTKIQGGPIKTVHFWRYHIFAATTDIIMQFLLKCSEITGENDKQQFKIYF